MEENPSREILSHFSRAERKEIDGKRGGGEKNNMTIKIEIAPLPVYDYNTPNLERGIGKMPSHSFFAWPRFQPATTSFRNRRLDKKIPADTAQEGRNSGEWRLNMTGMTMTLGVLLCAAGGPRDAVLLDFTAQWCGPCQKVKPLIDQMQQEGYPIKQIDVDRNPELAQRYRVQSMPTFVMVVDGREVDRVVGGGDPVVLRPRLERMFQKAMHVGDASQSEPSSALPRSFSEPRSDDPPVSPNEVSSQEAGHTPADFPRNGKLQSEEPAVPTSMSRQCVSASVRLRIEDSRGHSWGTGTIIDAREGKALVLTCGHIFRDSRGKGPIEVHLFGEGSMVKVPGQCLHYDEVADLGLVIFTPPGEVASIPVAPEGYRPKVGDEVLSVGCDGGATPTSRRHRIQSLDRVHSEQFAYVEVTGAPVQGRSGGGLFSREGYLLGVCNAADPRDNEGLFAPLVAIHRQLDQNQLAFVYESPAVGDRRLAKNASGTPASRAVASTEVLPASASLSDRQTLSTIENASMPRSMPPPESEPEPIALEEAGSARSGGMTAKEQATLEEIRRRQQDGAEVICIIKSCRDPESPSEIIVLKNASAAFRRALARGDHSDRTDISESLSRDDTIFSKEVGGEALSSARSDAAARDDLAPFQTTLSVPHARK
jgi:thiol-disulfide isomerase/thioredoxin